MTYVISDSTMAAGSQAIADISTVQKHPLGTIVRANSATYGAGEFIYLQGVADCALGSAVVYSADDYSTALVAANAIGPVGFAMGACIASTYGWFQIGGKAVGKVLTGFGDNALPYLTSTAGSLDDTAVAGDYVHRAKGASAIGTPSTGLAEFEIERPFVNNGTDDAVS